MLGGAVLAGEAWFLREMLTQNGRILRRLDDLETQNQRPDAAGQPQQGGAVSDQVGQINASPHSAPSAPRFSLPTLTGATVTLDMLRGRGKPLLLVFVHPTCGPCAALAPDLVRWQADQQHGLQVVIISQGTVEANQAKFAPYGSALVLLQQEREVAQSYGVNGTPGAVLINRDGQIASPPLLGADPIRALVARQASVGAPTAVPTPPLPNPAPSPAAQPPWQVGDLLPSTLFADVNGRSVDLAFFRGRSIVLLFWDAHCAGCADLLLTIARSTMIRSVVVISRTPAHQIENIPQGVTILFDTQAHPRSPFTPNPLPSAVRIDSTGKIATPLMSDRALILRLVDVAQPA